MAPGLTRRQVLRRAGMGAAALALPGGWRRAAGRATRPRPVSARRVEAVRGDEAELHLGEHGADVGDRRQPRAVQGADRDRHQDLAARADGAGAEGRARPRVGASGAYQIIYADPYQVLAPYHGALADLNAVQRRPEPAQGPGPRGLHPDPARRGRQVRRQGAIYALPYDAPTMIWMYRKDVFESQPRADAAGPRLRPDAQRRVDVGAVLRRRRSGSARTSRTASRTARAIRPSSTTR